jgi:hypothetical protein
VGRVPAYHRGSLDITDLEYWSAHRTMTISSLAPGQSRQVSWSLRLVKGGNYTAYANAIDQGSTRAAVGQEVPPLCEDEAEPQPWRRPAGGDRGAHCRGSRTLRAGVPAPQNFRHVDSRTMRKQPKVPSWFATGSSREASTTFCPSLMCLLGSPAKIPIRNETRKESTRDEPHNREVHHRP